VFRFSWPPRYEALNSARRTVTGKRHKYEYQCNMCEKWFKQKEVEVDHIESIGTLRQYEDLPTFVERLFVSVDELRVVCKPCHKKRTKEERNE
jgi:hypothetical protein